MKDPLLSTNTTFLLLLLWTSLTLPVSTLKGCAANDSKCHADNELFQAYQTKVNNNTTPHSKVSATEPHNSTHPLSADAAFRLEINAEQLTFHLQQGNMVPFWKRGKKTAESVVNDINITLSEVYNGYSKAASWVSTRICSVCQGRGAEPHHLTTCSTCHGTGVIHAAHDHSCFSSQDTDGRHPHHVHSQWDTRCSTCQGKGEVLKTDGHHCSHCNGTGVVEEFISRTITVPRGAQDGHLIFLKGAGNENNLVKAGDLIVRVNVLEHAVFVREDNNLVVGLNITLKEALLGFNRTFAHLNGTNITIVHSDITTPEREFVWVGLGLPIELEEEEHSEARETQQREGKEKGKEKENKDRPAGAEKNEVQMFGDLVMRVNVVLPERLQKHQSEAFQSALGN